METKTLEKLEFNKIKEILSSYAITYLGKSRSSCIMPMNNKKDIEKSLTQTTEAKTLIYKKGNIPLSEIDDITIPLKKIEDGNFLNASELLNMCKILKFSHELKDFFSNDINTTSFNSINIDEFVSLKPLFDNLYENKSIQKKIETTIISENEIADDASPKLLSIRKEIKNKSNEIKNKLNSFLHSKYLQEPIITTRYGRYVLPVKSEYRNEIKGFSHDTSASGSTIFIEPSSVFELNNEINNLKNDEEIEIEKILQMLSSLFFDISDQIKNDVNLIEMIDFIFAKAKYSIYLNANAPIITDEKQIILLNAWHPLLKREIAVKNDIIIDKNITSLIITGPNTGGKTVVLKTTGILMLMGLCGMHIPANEESKIYVADNIFADIGDDQSIIDSLSTFSSHISNISHILDKATTQSLVLIDELGSGTDPVQGESLAISILENLHQRNVLTIATTHYPKIKHYALVTDGFENASVEFNIETLSPTYKLLLGIPGSSNAFEISKKLGISDALIERAKYFMENDEINIENLLNEISENKRIIESEKEKILQNSKELEELKLKVQKENISLEKNEKEILQNAKQKAREILINAKEDANEIIKKLEKTNSNKEANEQRNLLNEKIKEFNNANSLSIKDNTQNQTNNKKRDFQAISAKYKNRKSNSFSRSTASSEINVIGMTVLEATDTIDKYLDTCSLSGISQVRIIHGKGSGKLRERNTKIFEKSSTCKII